MLRQPPAHARATNRGFPHLRLPPHTARPRPPPPPHTQPPQDCHKSFFAHADAVTAVGFVASTHYFFTAGKDGVLKYWDGDRFEHILTLGDVHKGEVWALAVSGDGTFFASAGADRAVRVWRRTEEQVFVEEEREKEMAGVMEKEGRDVDGEAIAAGMDAVGPLRADGTASPSAEGEGGRVVTAPLAGAEGAPPTALVAHATRDSARSGERLVDALALAEGELEAWGEYAADLASARAAEGDEAAAVASVEPPPRNPELLGLTPVRHVLKALRAIPPGDVDQVLLLLPFAQAASLMRMLVTCLRRGAGVELCARACLLLLRLHAPQLSAAPRHAPLLRALREGALAAVGAAKDVVGFNAAALRAWAAELEGEAVAALAFGQALSEEPEVKAKGRGEPLVSIGKRQKVRLL